MQIFNIVYSFVGVISRVYGRLLGLNKINKTQKNWNFFVIMNNFGNEYKLSLLLNIIITNMAIWSTNLI